MITSACLFILGYASTWAPYVGSHQHIYQRVLNIRLFFFCSGVWIIIGETFPTRSRAKQAAIATFCNWLFVRPYSQSLGTFFLL